MKVVIATRALSGVLGGLERQLGEIAKALCDFGFDVHLVYLSNSQEPLFFDFDKRISHHQIIGTTPEVRASVKIKILRQIEVFRLLRRISPNVVITFMTGSYFFLCIPSLLLRIPIVLAERNSPQIYRVTTASKYRGLIFLSMLFASRITTQFSEYINDYPRYLRGKFRVIPNSIPREIQSRTPRDRHSSQPLVYLFAGRFSFQKRLELLIRSFAQFSLDKTDVSLRVFGSGANAAEMESLIRDLGAEERIHLFRPSKELPIEILKADVLCIPSLWEGFPNVLLESLYLGVPGLGFSNCDGVRHLIVDGENGWLDEYVEDGSSLVSLLERSYLDLKSGKSMSKDCRESVKDFIPEKVYSKWQDLILDIAR